MGRRTLLLLASILVAAAGTAMIWVYVQNADARARATWTDQTTVLRAKATIDIGSGQDVVAALVEEVAVPAGIVPPKAIVTLADLKGRTTTTPVLAGEFLVSDQFGTQGASSGIQPRLMAVTVDLPDPNRSAGVLRPDTLVAVYYVPPGKDPLATVLIRSIRVLGVGNTTALRNASGRPAQIGTQTGVTADNVLLEANAPQVKALVLAKATGGQLWFAVLGSKDAAPPEGDTIRLDQLVPAASATR